MNFVVAVAGAVFVLFVILVALKGRKSAKVITKQIHSNVNCIYDSTQTRYLQKNGCASSELAQARATHLKTIGGQTGATKP